MAEKLTPQQAQAVKDRGGRLLVSAAAGSGKTKVLVDRLLSYLLDPKDPGNLDEFLIITYTKAAASELRAKIAAKLTEKIAQDPENRHLQKQMQRLFLTKISTVHGFCSDLLREYAFKLNLPADFRVADENECGELQLAVLEDLMEEAYRENSPDFRCFVDTQGLGRDDRKVPELILQVYNAARCHLDPEQWLSACEKDSRVEDVGDVSETVWGAYLIEDLHSTLDAQISILTQCVLLADGCPDFEKAALNLKDTLVQLQTLRNCSTWDEIVKGKNISYGTLRFPSKKGDPALADRIKAARDGLKKCLEKKLKVFSDPSDQVLEDLSQCAQAVRGLTALVRDFSGRYDKLKKTRRVLDFGDLEHKTLDLLLGKNRNTPTRAAKEIALRFREILVDEYQDSNEVQDAIFSALSEERKNCFMVGDVKQSIYQFRLADPGIFLEKYRSYAMAEKAQPREGRKVLLNANFRSGPEVIEAVNALFASCMSREVGGLAYTADEALREGVPHGLLPSPGTELLLLEADEESYPQEAAMVASKIQEMLLSGAQIREGQGFRSVKPEDIVILLRSPGSVGGYYQRALQSLGIRCSAGGGTNLLTTREVSDFRSLLETISNPRQDISLLSALMSPVFSMTADDLSAIRGEHGEGCIYDSLLESKNEKAIAFVETLGRLRTLSRSATLTELLQACLAETRLDSIYAAMEGGEARVSNLQTFFTLAADYEGTGIRDLREFLDYLTSLEDRGIQTADQGNSGAVTIMSIHKSKGLEFPVVFLSALSRKFNPENQRQQILCHKDLGLGLSVADRENRTRYPSLAKAAISCCIGSEGLSEEMRVLYVAMTRARDRLIMTYCHKNLGKKLQDMARRLDFDGGKQLCREAACPGDWVLLEALQRTEAGELHHLGDRPETVRVSELPWKIQVVEPDPETVTALEQGDPLGLTLPSDAEEVLKAALAYRYPHLPATMAPSKQTATGRKGREKDEEAAQLTPEPKQIKRIWREPSFREQKKQGTFYGTAVHSAMQYVDFSACGSLNGFREELSRIQKDGLISEEQMALLSPKKLYPFFETDIGRKLVEGAECLREFKFSILDDGENYGEGLAGEQVLLQGVVDCALLEEDGILLIDFKTDYVSEETLGEALDRYRLQIETYAQALERIFEKKVKKKLLYFFHLNRFVEVS